ncbi:MAG: MFS transporter [Deltaproteobacteria bacterium]|nr:MFS transporter [Deltaproteobacteria bacterium]
MPQPSRNDKSLRYSIGDGVFASLMNGFTLDYFTPFLLLLGGGARHVGFLSALPNLFSSLIQLKSADIAEKMRSRKRLINIFVLIQALMLIPMVMTFKLGEFKAASFIAIVVLFTSCGAFVAPAWGSLMADLIKDTRRGEYFGWRNKILGFVAIGSSFLAGFILHAAERYDVFWGFAAIFGAAFIFRLVSWRYLRKMHEPELVHREEDYFSIFDFIQRANTSNFARFVFFVSIMKFCVNIASPFFAVLMLRDLKFGYITYIAITLAATLATNLTIKRWGMHGDKVGNLKVIRLTSKLVAFLPLLWVVNQNPAYLFCVQVFAGFAWAGFNLSASNFIYDSSTPAKRTRCIAYYNVLTGVSLGIGALAGGFLAQKMTLSMFGFGLFNIILLSAALRLLVAFFMQFDLKEVRQVEKIKTHQLFLSMLKLKPAAVERDADLRK